MKFRDSSGKASNNPFSFLKQSGYLKDTRIKKRIELSLEEYEDSSFNLEFARIEYNNHKDLCKIFKDYFKDFYQIQENTKVNGELIKSCFLYRGYQISIIFVDNLSLILKPIVLKFLTYLSLYDYEINELSSKEIRISNYNPYRSFYTSLPYIYGDAYF